MNLLLAQVTMHESQGQNTLARGKRFHVNWRTRARIQNLDAALPGVARSN